MPHSFRKLLLLCGIACGLVLPVHAQDLGSATGGMARKAVAKVSPSVVQLRFSGGRVDATQEITTLGPATGTVVDSEGWIITSRYLLSQDPTTITAEFHDGRRLVAEHIADDEVFGLSLLKVNATDLQIPASLPSQNRVIGQWVIGVGRGYESRFPMMSVGILSAENRIWGKAFQIDANVSPLNYGGPVVDSLGNVMGVLLPLSPMANDPAAGVEWYDSGIGFAISWEDVQNSFQRMRAGGTLKQGRMGLTFADITEPLAEATVTQIRPEAPGAQAGVQIDDRIIQANGKPIRRLADLRNVVGRAYAGDTLALEMKRGEETVSVRLQLVETLPLRKAGYLGILLEPPASEDSALVVRHVLPNTPAAQAELQTGDIVLAIDEEPLKNAGEFRQAIASKSMGETISVQYKRGEEVFNIPLTLHQTDWSIDQPVPALTAVENEDLPKDQEEEFPIPEGSEGEPGWAFVPGTALEAGSASYLILLGRLDRTAKAELLPLWKREAIERQLVLFIPPRVEQGQLSTEDLPHLTELWKQFRTRYALQVRSLVLVGDENATPLLWPLMARQQSGIHALVSPVANLPVEMNELGGNREVLWLEVDSANASSTRSALQKKRSEQIRSQLKAAGLIHLTEPSLDQTKLWNVRSDIKRLATWIDALDRF